MTSIVPTTLQPFSKVNDSPHALSVERWFDLRWFVQLRLFLKIPIFGNRRAQPIRDSSGYCL